MIKERKRITFPFPLKQEYLMLGSINATAELKQKQGVKLCQSYVKGSSEIVRYKFLINLEEIYQFPTRKT